MKVDKLYPNICKHGSCLDLADYEFTDVKDGKTITLAYSCSKHVEDVRELLESIYNGSESGESNNGGEWGLALCNLRSKVPIIIATVGVGNNRKSDAEKAAMTSKN